MKKINPILREILDWIIHLSVALIIGFLIVSFIGQRAIVQGESMMPTLKNADQLIIEKISPKVKMLKYGDIVAINAKGLEGVRDIILIKRVIGVAGDRIEIKDEKVYLNNKVLKEDYIYGDTTNAVKEEFSDIIVPNGKVYVLGDNRIPMMSLDSRALGPLDVSRVYGKALVKLFPFESATVFKRPQENSLRS